MGRLVLRSNHRVLCGDSTNADDVARLLDGEDTQAVVTSPPYAAQRRYEMDDFDWDAVVPQAIVNAAGTLMEGGSALVNLGLVHKDGRVIEYWRPLFDAMDDAEKPLFAWYVWDKQNGLPGDWNGRLAPAHEWVFHFARSPRRPAKTKACKYAGEVSHPEGAMHGLRDQKGKVGAWQHDGKPTNETKIPDSVIRAQPVKGECFGHPAPFSIEFAAELIEPFVRRGEMVYDPFLGLGTTVMAAQQLGRRCVGMEIEPSYVQITLERWKKMTGEEAIRG